MENCRRFFATPDFIATTDVTATTDSNQIAGNAHTGQRLRHTLRHTVWKAVLFASMSLLGPGTAAADTGSISLRFNWPSDLHADVSYRRKKVAMVRGQQQKSELSGTYTLNTSKHDNGLLIEKSDAHADTTPQSAEGPAELQAIIKRLSTITPDYVVSHAGEMIGVTGMDELRHAMQAELAPVIAELPGSAAEGFTSFLDKALSDESLHAGIDGEWSRMVGQWIGQEFEPGRTYDVEFTTPVPLSGHVGLPTKGTYEVLGRVACDSQPGAYARADASSRNATPASVSTDCVELSFNSHFDPDAAAALVADMLESSGMKPDMAFTMKMNYQLLLITEPDTLLPHASSELTAMSAVTPDGSIATSQTETSYKTYRYIQR